MRGNFVPKQVSITLRYKRYARCKAPTRAALDGASAGLCRSSVPRGAVPPFTCTSLTGDVLLCADSTHSDHVVNSRNSAVFQPFPTTYLHPAPPEDDHRSRPFLNLTFSHSQHVWV